MDIMNIDFSVEALKTQVREIMDGQRESLVKGIVIAGALAIPFMVCSFIVADTANAGFNIVLTAFMEIAFLAGCYYALAMRPSRSGMEIGFLIGTSGLMTIIMLMTAIFWGQLANCEVVDDEINQYTCTRPFAYSGVSFFSSLLFIVQVFFTYGAVIWRNELVSLEESDYGKVPLAGNTGAESSSYEHGLHQDSTDL